MRGRIDCVRIPRCALWPSVDFDAELRCPEAVFLGCFTPIRVEQAEMGARMPLAEWIRFAWMTTACTKQSWVL